MTPGKKNIALNNDEIILRKILVEVAAKGEMLYYSDLTIENDDFHMNKLSKMLSRISRYEMNEDRPFLCAIVIAKSTGYPGVGFYELCHTLNISKSPEALQKECFSYWGRG